MGLAAARSSQEQSATAKQCKAASLSKAASQEAGSAQLQQHPRREMGAPTRGF
jgi:hypothetical protein